MVRNAHPDARMLLGSKNNTQDHLYRQMYLVGDRRPLGRPAAEASCLGDRLRSIKVLPTDKPKAEAKKRKKAAKTDDES